MPVVREPGAGEFVDGMPWTFVLVRCSVFSHTLSKFIFAAVRA